MNYLKIAVVVLIVGFMSGCGPNSEAERRQLVVNAFSNGIVTTVPDNASRDSFLVQKPNGEVWFVKTHNTDLDITTTLLFNAIQPAQPIDAIPRFQWPEK